MLDAKEVNLEEESSRFRKLTGFSRKLQLAMGILTPLTGVAFILNVPYYINGVSLHPQQFLGLMLSFVLTYIYLAAPFKKGHTNQSVPWFDWLFIGISVCGGLYVAFFYDQLLMSIGVVDPVTVAIGSSLILAILEATRRLTGWPLLIIIAVFALYGRYGYLLPGFLAAREITWPRLINQLYLGSEFVFGTALQIAGMVVLAFVLFGQFLFGTGGASFLLNVAQAGMGRYRGGPAKIAIVASALFGTLSGNAVGNVAAIGVVTIPLMKRTGYPAYFSGAVEAVSSTGGTIMPPVMGAAAFIMAQFLGLPYYQVALVAAIPAVLYYLGQFIQVDLRAAKEGMKGIPKEELPTWKNTLKTGWVYIAPVIVLIYALFGLGLRAELAAMYSLGSLMLVALISPSTRNYWKKIPKMLEDTTVGMLEISVVCAAAGLVIGVMSYTGLGLSFSRLLTELGGGNLLLLAFLTAIASTILGMGMPVTATYLFLSVLAAPAMVKMGVEPLLAHLFVFYFGAYSFLTPPVCLAVYAAASIAKAPMFKTAVQALKLASAGYIVPFIFLYKPATVFMGQPLEVAFSIIDGLLAVFALAVAAENYFRRPLKVVERILYLVSSLAFFVPGWESRIVALVLLVLLLAFNYFYKTSNSITEADSITPADSVTKA